MEFINMSKVIPTPVDVVGRNVSWKPTPTSDRLFGQVVKVWLVHGPDPRYPKGSKGYKNGIRALFKKLDIEIGDGRVFTVSGEHEDLKKIGMVAE